MIYKKSKKYFTFMIVFLILLIAYFIMNMVNLLIHPDYYADDPMIMILMVCMIICIVLLSFMIFKYKSLDKKSKYLRQEISKVRTIICEGPAVHKIGVVNEFYGWLFFSEDALEFYPIKMNRDGARNIAILIDDIIDVETKRNKRNILFIDSKGGSFIFSVDKPELWKNTIKETIGKTNIGTAAK